MSFKGKTHQPTQTEILSSQGTVEGEDDLIVYHPERNLRISFQGKLTLAILGTVSPLLIITLWLFGGEKNTLWILLGGFIATIVGLSLVQWASKPISALSHQAKTLAGLKTESRHLFGMLSTEPPGDEVISNALEKIERNLSEIQSLYNISQLITSNTDLEGTLGGIVKEAVDLLDADAGLIGLWDPEKEVFQDIAACNLPIAFPGREFGASESFTSQIAKTGRVTFLDDYGSYPHRIEELDEFKFRATLGAPLMIKGESTGAITILSRDQSRQFTFHDGNLLATFASQAGAALDKIRLYQIAVDQLEDLTLAKEQLALERQELAQAFSNMVHVQETERDRIAADIHDGVVQSMVGALFELRAVLVQFSNAPEELYTKIERVQNLLEESILELRRVIYNLRPLTLDRAGLAPAVEQLAEEFEKMAGIRPRIEVFGTPYRFSSQAETAAYRIIQESLNNACKHAHASSVDIVLRFYSDQIGISVIDNGMGFSTEENVPHQGKQVGLIGMKDRALSVDGDLSISSVINEGTKISLTLPRSSPDMRMQNDGGEMESITKAITTDQEE
jgi:signal transduction histidine kinase